MKVKEFKPQTREQKALLKQIVELNEVVHTLGYYLQKHLEFSKSNPAFHAYPIRLYLEEKDVKLTITAIDNEMKRLRTEYQKSIDDAIEQLRHKQESVFTKSKTYFVPKEEATTIEESIRDDMKKSKLGE